VYFRRRKHDFYKFIFTFFQETGFSQFKGQDPFKSSTDYYPAINNTKKYLLIGNTVTRLSFCWTVPLKNTFVNIYITSVKELVEDVRYHNLAMKYVL
jgi:hypothetical protein